MLKQLQIASPPAGLGLQLLKGLLLALACLQSSCKQSSFVLNKEAPECCQPRAVDDWSKRHLFAGWITGHTYLAYGPLLCNATCVIYEGVPSYPTPARCWEIVEKFKVSSHICKSELGLFFFSAIS